MLTVYTTNTCPYCPMVKKYLTMKGVEYQEVDITNDSQTRQRLYEKTKAMTVPITTDGENYVIGFQLGKLADMAKATV